MSRVTSEGRLSKRPVSSPQHQSLKYIFSHIQRHTQSHFDFFIIRSSIENPLSNSNLIILKQRRQMPVLEGRDPTRFSVLPGTKRISPRQVGTQEKGHTPGRSENLVGIWPSRTGLPALSFHV